MYKMYCSVLLVLTLVAHSSCVPLIGRHGRNDAKAWPGFDGIQTIFFFGDSYTTVKFDVDGDQPAEDNPLGNPEYPGSTSSNGPNWADLLTVKYNESLVFSYDFAASGSTVDAAIVDNGYDLNSQVYADFIPNYAGTDRIWESESSLFAFWFGINDLVYSYGAENSSDIQSAIISRYSFLVGKLYAEGARNFLLLNVPPIERAPRIAGSSAADERVPLAGNATLEFNERIEWLADRIVTRHSDAKVFLFDAHTLFNEVIDDPEQFDQTADFQDVTGYCSAYQNGTPDIDTKLDECAYAANQYLWLNNLHPISPMHDLIASQIAGLMSV